jgi:rhamnosyltransferase
MDGTDLSITDKRANLLLSVVVRTLNEARYLPELLQGVARQRQNGLRVETVLVDSGSTDGTLQIAQDYGCVITHIRREEFSFGRSLNRGCEVASGDILVFVSGHCVPTDEHWLQRLSQPIVDGLAAYSYGRQLGGPDSRYSECRIFEKYYPAQSRIPQQGFFCNNANSALAREAWATHRFDEELTGLEDMELAKRLVAAGGKVAYVAEAAVYHHHQESWAQVQRRFEREAIALQKIMPQIHVGLTDTARYITSSIRHDVRQARANGGLKGRLAEIVRYRVAQYSGSYKGNHEHRKLSRSEKDHYFYPSDPLERL